MRYHFKLNAWYGRLGNNLQQVSNGIYCALRTKSIFSFKEHPVLQRKAFDFSESKLIFKPFAKTMKSDFWDLTKISKKSILSAELLGEPHRKAMPTIAKEYILPLLPYRKIENHPPFVVHIRGGDTFDENRLVHSLYLSASLAYFLKIFALEKPEKILLVAEDKRNPAVDLLLQTDYNIIFQSSTIEEDLNAILNADILVIGGFTSFTSFSSFLSLCSPNLKKCYFPSFLGEGTFAIIGNKTVPVSFVRIQGVHNNYMKEWKNTPEQIALIKSHPLNDIELIPVASQNT